MVTEFSLLVKLQRVLQSDLQETSLHGDIPLENINFLCLTRFCIQVDFFSSLMMG